MQKKAHIKFKPKINFKQIQCKNLKPRKQKNVIKIKNSRTSPVEHHKTSKGSIKQRRWKEFYLLITIQKLPKETLQDIFKGVWRAFEGGGGKGCESVN